MVLHEMGQVDESLQVFLHCLSVDEDFPCAKRQVEKVRELRMGSVCDGKHNLLSFLRVSWAVVTQCWLEELDSKTLRGKDSSGARGNCFWFWSNRTRTYQFYILQRPLIDCEVVMHYATYRKVHSVHSFHQDDLSWNYMSCQLIQSCDFL